MPNGFAKQRSKARKGIADFGKWLKKAKLGFGNLQFPVFVVGLQFVKIMKFNAGALDVVCRGEFMKLGGGSAERLKAAGLSEQQLNDWVDEFSGGWVSKWVKENVVCEGKRFENGKVVLVPNFGLGFIVEHYDVNGRGSLQLDVAQRVFESGGALSHRFRRTGLDRQLHRGACRPRLHSSCAPVHGCT